MYNCNGCKRQINDEPVMANAAGKFCQTCEDLRKERLKEAIERKHELLNGRCLWCNDSVESHNVRDHICGKCKSGRGWLLKCIRNSDRAAKYVAARETEEAPARLARVEAHYEASRPAVNGRPVPMETESRLSRMEGMIEKLMNALGE